MPPVATLSLKEWGSGIIVVTLLITLALLGNFLKPPVRRNMEAEPLPDRSRR
jgi:hypothetical protein